MKKTIRILTLLLLAFFVTGCDYLVSTGGIRNNITNVVVEYKEMSIEDFETAVEVAVDRVEDAVIGITLKESDATVSIGSGVIYKREEVMNPTESYKYYVITNRHVIKGEDSSKTYDIYAFLGKEDIEIKATLVGYDSKVDLALVTFVHTKNINPVQFAPIDEPLKKGSFAIAIGNPDGYNYYGSATFGIISGPLRYISDDTDGDGTDDFYSEYVQHDVAINPGNSGGGLFNMYGQLIGINTLKLVNTNIDNMGFAIPHTVVHKIITEYLELGIDIVRPRLGVLGIEVRSLTPASIDGVDIKSIPDIYGDEAQYGIYVSNITIGSTLSGSGILKHDIILAMDDIKITRTYIIAAKLNSLLDYKVGDKVMIKYYSRLTNKVRTVQVTLKDIG